MVSLVQMDVLEMHTWNSTIDRVEQPNRIVLDIDPGDEVSFKQVVAAARLVRSMLDALGLAGFLKTTGGRGLHVVVPLTPHADWSECLEFSRAIAEAIARQHPQSYTTTYAKAGRERKLLIDYLRNNRTNTSVAAFSTRANPRATVSMPIAWDDLPARLNPDAFTVKTVAQRLARLRADPWRDYWSTKQKLSGKVMEAVRAL